LHITTTLSTQLNSSLLKKVAFWISASTNKDDLECPIQLKVRFTDGTLDVRICSGFRSWPCVTGWKWVLDLTVSNKMRPMNCDFKAYEVRTNFRRGLLQRGDEAELSR